jgi:hypothetical protein
MAPVGLLCNISTDAPAVLSLVWRLLMPFLSVIIVASVCL